VRVNMVIAKGLWDTLADPGQIENALLNLAINARDAMPKGGDLTIETSNMPAKRRGRSKDYVRLTIADEGVGMPPEVLERAFDPFFTTKQGGKGSGLGLSMVYGFVKQSGGNISIDSAPGEGTTITIDLPRSDTTAAESDLERIEKSEPHGSEKILVVEDDPRVRKVSVRRLKSLGYDVVEAESGDAALTVLERKPDIDLVFTDIVMAGGMDGVQLAERVKEQYRKVKILLTTGYPSGLLDSETGDADLSGLGIGTIGTKWPILRKPHTKQELATRVREALERSSRSR